MLYYFSRHQFAPSLVKASCETSSAIFLQAAFKLLFSPNLDLGYLKLQVEHLMWLVPYTLLETTVVLVYATAASGQLQNLCFKSPACIVAVKLWFQWGVTQISCELVRISSTTHPSAPEAFMVVLGFYLNGFTASLALEVLMLSVNAI